MNCEHYIEPRGTKSTRWRAFCQKKKIYVDPAICGLCVQKETRTNEEEETGKEKNMNIEPEILEHYGTISTNERNGWKREVNLVSWGGAPEKYDIRDWAPDHERSGKCGTFTAAELRNLRDILNQMDLEKE